ncbi:BMP family protein [Trichocoleus sp. DQ-A3]|uniref:BMP family protein n=1 Tax=Cyanophyceae TaxID=3028117 RepID=UPI001685861C|nr:BMP family protein [Coleofasciculus sp. FACHB-125]MBD1900542.1 BMP family protein [Coleofasciculus sp. FACHB-125]
MMEYSRRKFLLYGSATLGTSLLLKACNSSPTPTETAASGDTSAKTGKDFKVAIVLPGIITDKAWNQAGYEGVTTAKEKLGVEIAHVEKVEQADQAEALSDFARRGYNLVYAHGGQFDAAIEQVAAQFPKTFFVGVNGTVKGDNMASLRIDHLQTSYLCGIIGALMTKSNKMAYLAAQSFQGTDEELRGLELGAKSVKPDIKIAASYTGDWNDAAKAKEATQALISSGVDVVYQWLDNASPAVLQTAAEKGAFAFGNTTDQLDVAPKAVLTSAVKRIDLAIAYLADLAVKGNLKGEIYTIGLENPEILYLGKFGAMVPKNVEEKALNTKQAILAKKVTFEACKEGGKDTRCVKQA